MMNFLGKILNHMSNYTEKVVVGLSLIGIIALTINLIVAVVFRYIFKAPIYFANELSLFLFGMITFLGGSLGVKRSTLASVTFIVDKLKGVSKNIVVLFIQFNILAFGILIFYFSYFWITDKNILNQMASTMAIPLWVPYSIIPVSMIFIIIFSLDNIYKGLAGREKTHV
ncbi:TRAP transporter small permease [Alkalihalobacterium alkalinitrilicum]|uniref:TRAP transporter small permease n=1 Tax=Alkalihalobacterium alkalinitrilicum TaxID=427920 RepID=UPI0009951760|nr:TRAP transporter small permease [Alkalihalobacterium alkalinitrilicum]